MVNPTTVNVGIIVPLTGADVDTWGAVDVNPNMVAIDGMIAGVQTIGLTNVPVTLTKPAGFAPTPGGGPTQAQNSTLRFTGILTANILVTMSLPGKYIIENRTTGNFTIQFTANPAGLRVAVPRGARSLVYNDGTDAYLIDGAVPGKMEMWAGLSAVPVWVGFCTAKPWLLCDGSVYNFADFPALAAQLLGTFGGNGISTFAVPDLRGRVPLAYDGTGTRITVAGCGINGQTLGASLDIQANTLVANQIPPLTSVIAANAISVVSTVGNIGQGVNTGDVSLALGAAAVLSGFANGTRINSSITSQNANPINATYANGAVQDIPNVQPSLVTGIWVIHT